MEKARPAIPRGRPQTRSKGRRAFGLGLSSILLIPGCIVFVVLLSFLLPRHPDREVLFLFLLLLSVLTAPILGISAWIMGQTELRNIRAGIVPASALQPARTGRTLGIIGTFANIAILMGVVVLLPMFTSSGVAADRDAVIADLTDLFADAHRYRLRPASSGGGAGSYSGYAIPPNRRITQFGKYTATVLHPDTIRFDGKSIQDSSRTVSVKIDATGRAIGDWTSWTYGGDFEL